MIAAVQILRNCRQAMEPNGRLLLVEMVIPPGDDPHPGKMLDMVMLSLPGGMERSEQEYRELLDTAGFRLTQVIPTQTPASVIEAVPVEDTASGWFRARAGLVTRCSGPWLWRIATRLTPTGRTNGQDDLVGRLGSCRRSRPWSR